jgi:hypothetical protein
MRNLQSLPSHRGLQNLQAAAYKALALKLKLSVENKFSEQLI